MSTHYVLLGNGDEPWTPDEGDLLRVLSRPPAEGEWIVPVRFTEPDPEPAQIPGCRCPIVTHVKDNWWTVYCVPHESVLAARLTVSKEGTRNDAIREWNKLAAMLTDD